LEKAVLHTDENLATSAAKLVLSASLNVLEVIDDGGVRDVEKLTDMYGSERIFLSHVLASAGAFYAAFDILRPEMLEGSEGLTQKIVIDAVERDIHDIVKDPVKTMMETDPYNRIEMGREVPMDHFV